MANKPINELANGTTPQDTDVVPVDRGSGPWSTVKLSILSIYTYILGKLTTDNRAVPTGGSTGNVLKRGSFGTVEWSPTGLVPEGSVSGYFLKQISATPYDVAFALVRELPQPDPGGADDGKFVQYDGAGSWTYTFPPEGLPTYSAPADNNKVITLVAGVPDWVAPADQSAGSSGQLQYRGVSGGFLAAALSNIGSTGSFDLSLDNAPPLPATDKLTVYAGKRGGRTQLAQRSTQGAALPVQTSIAYSRYGYWSTIGGANTAPTGVGIVAPTLGGGTAAGRTPAATNLLASTRRIGNTSAATAGSSAGFRASTRLFFRNSTDPWGGFYCVFRFGEGNILSDSRAFCGMIADNGLIANVNPSTLLSTVGMAYDSGETTWRILHNDTSGTATRIDLGSNFPCNTDDVAYEITISSPPGQASVWVEVWRMGTIHRTTVEISSSDLPASGTLLAPQLWVNNGTNAAAKTVDLIQMYIESDY